MPIMSMGGYGGANISKQFVVGKRNFIIDVFFVILPTQTKRR